MGEEEKKTENEEEEEEKEEEEEAKEGEKQKVEEEEVEEEEGKEEEYIGEVDSKLNDRGQYIAINKHCSYCWVEKKSQRQNKTSSNSKGDANVMKRETKTT